MENYYRDLSNSWLAYKFEFFGLSVGREYGVQCQAPEQCMYSGDHAVCVQVGIRNMCQCAAGYHFVDEIKLCVQTEGECLLFYSTYPSIWNIFLKIILWGNEGNCTFRNRLFELFH
jgi:hypothetical protein